uniref:Ribosomal protein S12 n=1 Tax=Ishige okamurae TaxID=233772 RepID=A0A4Y5T7X3_9PHAE|nr:ribosomal protein S12 [Ishige okamurae]
MPTFNQLSKSCRGKKIKHKKSRILRGCPQKRGTCVKVVTLSPKKPNSARRQATKVRFPNKLRLMAYIPGQIHRLQEHSQVLIRGGRVPDLPGVNYHIIRGQFDLRGLDNRKTSRSKYGTKKPA